MVNALNYSCCAYRECAFSVYYINTVVRLCVSKLPRKSVTSLSSNGVKTHVAMLLGMFQVLGQRCVVDYISHRGLLVVQTRDDNLLELHPFLCSPQNETTPGQDGATSSPGEYTV